jgi:UDP-glucose 4-epimerase
MIIGDIENYESVSNAVKDAEIVYNFAALSDLNKALDEPKILQR